MCSRRRPTRVDAGLVLLPADVRAAKWNRELVQKGMTPTGGFLLEALTAMGCADRIDDIKSVRT